MQSAIKHTSTAWDIELFVQPGHPDLASIQLFLDRVPRNSRVSMLPSHLVNTGTYDQNRVFINYITMRRTGSIWTYIRSELIFFIQSDGVVCRPGIDKFTMYDYVGAPWIHQPDGLTVGNGGMSLRRRSFMLHCAENYTNHRNDPEDVFFGNCARDHGHVPEVETAKQFVEAIWFESPLTIHKPWEAQLFNPQWTSTQAWDNMLRVCPDIRTIPHFKQHFLNSTAPGTS